MNKPEFIIKVSAEAMQGLLTNETARARIKSEADAKHVNSEIEISRSSVNYAEALWAELASKEYVREEKED